MSAEEVDLLVASAHRGRSGAHWLAVTFAHVFPFRPWTATIIANLVKDAAGRRSREGARAWEATIEQGDHPDPLFPPAGGPTVEELVDLALARVRVPDLRELIVHEHRNGRKRAEHMRHTLARLPPRTVEALDLHLNGELRLGELSRAQTDAQMAANLRTTVNNVVNTRAHLRKFVEAHHPALAGSLELVLSIALGKVDPVDRRL